MRKNVLQDCLLVICLLVVVGGCSPATTRQKLVGRWKGAPQVKEAVDEMVQTTAQGQEVNPLAQGAARFLGNALAKATMSVEIDMRPSGAVFFSGNTEMLGVPPDSEGTWEVVSANDDVAHVEFAVDDKTYVAKIVLRDADEFMLKMEPPGTPAAQNPATQTPAEPAAGQVAAVPAAKPAVSDDDKAYEDDDPPAVAVPPPKAAPVAPPAVKPAPATPAAEGPAKKPAASILFKRSSG